MSRAYSTCPPMTESRVISVLKYAILSPWILHGTPLINFEGQYTRNRILLLRKVLMHPYISSGTTWHLVNQQSFDAVKGTSPKYNGHKADQPKSTRDESRKKVRAEAFEECVSSPRSLNEEVSIYSVRLQSSVMVPPSTSFQPLVHNLPHIHLRVVHISQLTCLVVMWFPFSSW